MPESSNLRSDRTELVQRASFLRTVCSGKSVLHLGCTNWPYREQSAGDDRFIHFALLEVAKSVCGLDADEDGIKALRQQGVDDLHVGDLENLGDFDFVGHERKFDVIVAGEVIEHLSCPGKMLHGVQRFMTPDTRLVITTVNAYCAFRFAVYALRGRGGLVEPVHPDHVSYYSRSTLQHVAHRAGLSMEQFCFYDLGREHRPYTRAGVRLINDIAVRIFPQLADGVIGVFKLQAPELQQ